MSMSDIPESLRRQLAPRRQLHPLAYALIAMAATFGGVSAFVLLSRPPPVIVMQVPNAGLPAPSKSGSAVAPSSSGTTTPETQSDAGVINLPGVMPAVAPGRPTDGAAPAPSGASSANIDMSGFKTRGVDGPSPTGPDGVEGGGGGATGLSGSEVNSVVAAGQPTLRRKCWQPALDAVAGSGPSARVQVNLVVAPSGAVQSVTASGAERDYPGLSSCLAGRIKGWQFPPSGGTTPVSIPFHFAPQ